ncbi:AAA family ATPase [Aspergillus luchuensis]|uniref:AAA family ATPase n=1 Tax=Aspergillus kawachii TaxID=1069201 RepID=A0A146FL21_ASPKA|nr:AAA family ATPase [Aspergillus luchuensis]
MNLPINGWLTTGPTAGPNDHPELPSTALQGSSARLPVQLATVVFLTDS